MYSIEHVARELMLEPADLQEIYEEFFPEAAAMLSLCEREIQNDNEHLVRHGLHGIKGMAANLRMEELVGMLKEMEQWAKSGQFECIKSKLPALKQCIRSLEEQVEIYYT
jgi:HPt (histidine-containing phosphotransfer) domain-containing protein